MPPRFPVAKVRHMITGRAKLSTFCKMLFDKVHGNRDFLSSKSHYNAPGAPRVYSEN